MDNTGDEKANAMLKLTSITRSEERGCLKNEDLRDVHKCQLSDNSGGRNGGRTTAETTNLEAQGQSMPEGGSELRVNDIYRNEDTDISEKEGCQMARSSTVQMEGLQKDSRCRDSNIHGGRARIVGKKTSVGTNSHPAIAERRHQHPASGFD